MCGSLSDRVHSAYQRRLADLPWQGRIVEIRVRSRRFRCPIADWLRTIFTERLPEVAMGPAARSAVVGFCFEILDRAVVVWAVMRQAEVIEEPRKRP